MKKECINAVNSKAGRELTEGEITGIEEQMRAAYKTLQRKDADAFNSMSARERYVNAAQIAKERMVENRVDAHMRQLENTRKVEDFFKQIDALPQSRSGGLFRKNKAVSWMYKFIDGVEKTKKATNAFLLSTVDRKLYDVLQDETHAKGILSVIMDGKDIPEYNGYAKDLKKLMDETHRKLNDAGIKVNYNERFGVTQKLDSFLVRDRDKAEFVNDSLQHLHPDVFLNVDGTRKTPEQSKKIVEESRDKIADDGKTETDEDGKITNRRRSAIDTSRNATRQFYYKNAESHRFMMEKYGQYPDVYNGVMSYISGAARDIALAGKLGTDAIGTFKKGTARAESNLTRSDKAIPVKESQKIKGQFNSLNRVFDAYVHPEGVGNSTWAKIGHNMRGATSLALIGDVFAALPDLASFKVMAGVHNLPFMRAMKDFVKFAGNSEQNQLLSHNLGISIDDLTHTMGRHATDVIGTGVVDRLNQVQQKIAGHRLFDRGIKGGVRTAVLNTVGFMTRKHATLEAAMADSSIVNHIGMTQAQWEVLGLSELEKGPEGNRTIISQQHVRQVPLDNVKEVMAKHNQSTDGNYAKVIGEIKRKIGDVQDKMTLAHSNYQSYRLKRIAIRDKYIKNTEKSYEKNEILKEKRVYLYNEKLDLMDLNNDLETKLAGMKDAHGLQVGKLLQAIYNGTDLLKKKTTKLVYDAQGKILNFKNDQTDTGSARLFKETGKLTDAIGEKVDKVTNLISRNDLKLTDKNDQFSEDVLETAVKYINNRAKMQERIRQLQSDVDLITKKEKVQKKVNQAEKNLNDAFDEMNERLAKHEQNLNRLSDYLGEFEKHKFQASDKDAMKLRDDAAIKLLELTEFFTHRMARGASQASITDKVSLGLHHPAGTLTGELMRFAMQFKQIPFGVLKQHWAQMGELEGNFTKTNYMLRAAIWLTVAGAVSGQIKALARGEDLKSVNPYTEQGRNFIMESFLRGGFLGIYGDLTLNSTRGLYDMLGPVPGILNKVDMERKTALGEALSGKDTKHSYLGAGWGIGGRMMPFSGVSYLKGGYNHLIYNRVADWIQPGYSAKQEAKYKKTGGSYYWPPTKALPQRLPSTDNLLKGTRQ